jgi:hypothetical protein
MMKQIIRTVLIGFLLFNISCSQNYHAEVLPDSLLINDVISSVIHIDSIELNNYYISNPIKNISTYESIELKNDTIIAPPPPFSISTEELFSYFNSAAEKPIGQKDSVFIALQLDTKKEITLSKKIISDFNFNSKKFYLFSIPVFSSNKQLVLVYYWRNCGNLCGDCHILILKKEEKGWIKIKHWSCGVS